jgi:hypothetical protein
MGWSSESDERNSDSPFVRTSGCHFVNRRLPPVTRRKADEVRWGSGERDERFAVFSKTGFTDGREDELDDTWTVFDLADVDRLLAP